MAETLRAVMTVPGLLDENDTALLFHDLGIMQRRLKNVESAFPEGSLHAVAIKANPLPTLLRKIVNLGFGLEAAGMTELLMAENAGLAAEKTVFDSPAKTKDEIAYALQKGICLHADSFEELERIDLLLKKKESSSHIGLRLNPQVGAGSIASTSVADEQSKFGIPLHGNERTIRDCFLRYPWLRGLHLHIGSQGCPVPLLLKGIGKVYDFALEINMELPVGQSIHTFDIGGGLPVAYRPGQEVVDMDGFSAALRRRCPALFDGSFRLITEFGRYVHANAGWAVSQVEYVKPYGAGQTLVTHLGADFMLRKCYNPNDWHHEIALLDRNGFLKTGLPLTETIVAGPLCFAGDVLARSIMLPQAVSGDHILISDTGAYTYSMWSRYNSRPMPKIIGYGPEMNHFETLKQRETNDQAAGFWR